MKEKIQKYYEAILAKTEAGDLDIVRCPSLSEAKRALKRMINGQNFSDAYIRKFEYNERVEDFEAIQDYNFK